MSSIGLSFILLMGILDPISLVNQVERATSHVLYWEIRHGSWCSMKPIHSLAKLIDMSSLMAALTSIY
jgi:hypothetical protein